MSSLKPCMVALGLFVTANAVADTAPALELAPGWYEGYNDKFLDYKGLQIDSDGNHRVLTAHLSGGFIQRAQVTFADDDITCSNYDCVIDVPELTQDGYRNRFVLSPSPGGGWYVMENAATEEGELVLTETYKLIENDQGSDGYEFMTRYQEQLKDMQEPSGDSLDGLWIGLRELDTQTNLIALEYKNGDPATLVTFIPGHSGGVEFAAENIVVDDYSLGLSAQHGTIERQISLDIHSNIMLRGYMLDTFPNGVRRRSSLKLIRVQPAATQPSEVSHEN